MTGLKELYVSAAARSRCAPQKTEENEWKRAFEYADERDLAKALDSYFDRASRNGQVFMPKVPELSPLVESARRSRAARASSESELIGWRCPDCGYSCCGYFPVGYSEQRYCQAGSKRPGAQQGEICGGNLETTHREAA